MPRMECGVHGECMGRISSFLTSELRADGCSPVWVPSIGEADTISGDAVMGSVPSSDVMLLIVVASGPELWRSEVVSFMFLVSCRCLAR